MPKMWSPPCLAPDSIPNPSRTPTMILALSPNHPLPIISYQNIDIYSPQCLSPPWSTPKFPSPGPRVGAIAGPRLRWWEMSQNIMDICLIHPWNIAYIGTFQQVNLQNFPPWEFIQYIKGHGIYQYKVTAIYPGISAILLLSDVTVTSLWHTGVQIRDVSLTSLWSRRG